MLLRDACQCTCQFLKKSHNKSLSAGNLTPRAREASPFMKTVQGFLALRRSSGSGLSISSQASPKEQGSSSPHAFSPLGSGLSTAVTMESLGAVSHGGVKVEVLALAGAADTQEAAQGDTSAQLPPPASIGKPGMGLEGSLAARLACEAAVQARKKASAPATAFDETPEAGTSAISPQPATEGAQPEGQLQIMEGPLVMTVGAAEPMARKKGARSPRGPAPICPEASDKRTTACSAGLTPAQIPSAAPEPIVNAPAAALSAEAAPAPECTPDDVTADHAAMPWCHGSALGAQALDEDVDTAGAADMQAAAPSTPVPDHLGALLQQL